MPVAGLSGRDSLFVGHKRSNRERINSPSHLTISRRPRSPKQRQPTSIIRRSKLNRSPRPRRCILSHGRRRG
jgi:hypothetical protein